MTGRQGKWITGAVLGLALALLVAFTLGCSKKVDIGCQRYVACCKALMAGADTKGPFTDACYKADNAPSQNCGSYLGAVTQVSVKTRIRLPAACNP